MNEAETRAELIDLKLRASGWITGGDVRVLREYAINQGEIGINGVRKRALKADYVLCYKNTKLAVIEAKSNEVYVGEGVGQAKLYAKKLGLSWSFATNGKEIYQIGLNPPSEVLIDHFPTPEELWECCFGNINTWQNTFSTVPFKYVSNDKHPRYYQEIAINRTLAAIAQDKKRILLTLATGTGKTFIAFQVAWKLFQSRWNLQHDRKRRPRILFLADRNILADQAYNAFTPFPPDALVRIRPKEIEKRSGEVPKNGNIFFTIFQTFMSGTEGEKYFTAYEHDFFDLVIIDECHRGGANDESTWRGILDHFDCAVHLGLTATPKRDENVDTYAYFDNPVFSYSLKEGIEDGFLTPFKIKHIKTPLDQYTYNQDDIVIQGEVDKDRVYDEKDFRQKKIFIEDRDCIRVQAMLKAIPSKEKAIVFCNDQEHAARVRDIVRDIINQEAKSSESDYCVRVTSDEKEIGETYLRQFQDNDKATPTILTTSQKLSTGVDVLNLRHIVIMRKIESRIVFKQIIGRGTRLYEGKHYFTIIDFVGAYHLYNDPEWDSEPVELTTLELENAQKSENVTTSSSNPRTQRDQSSEYPETIIIKLSDGRVRELIKSVSCTVLFSVNDKLISAEEFLRYLFDTLELPKLLGSKEKLCQRWGNPCTRQELLKELENVGCTKEDLLELQKCILVDSDLFDVLAYTAYAHPVISREERVKARQERIYTSLHNDDQCQFVSGVLNNYIKKGVDELDSCKLSDVLIAQYGSISDIPGSLGDNSQIRSIFIDFQKHLYNEATHSSFA